MKDGNEGSLDQDARRAARREAFFSTVSLISLTYTGYSLPHLFSWNVGSFCPLGTPFPLPEFSSTSGTAWPRQCCMCSKGVSRPYPLRTVGLSAFGILSIFWSLRFMLINIYDVVHGIESFCISLRYLSVAWSSPQSPLCVCGGGEWLCVCDCVCVVVCVYVYAHVHIQVHVYMHAFGDLRNCPL